MTSSNSEVKTIAAELKHLTLKRQQLLERKKILCILQELRNRAEFEQTEQGASAQTELANIEDTLKQVIEKKAELQVHYDNILGASDKKTIAKEVRFSSSEEAVPDKPASVSNVFYVEAPPSSPAPKVILELDSLPPCPSRTQCPECQQFIVTETFTSVSSVTWLVCVMTALMGCVAGCCLIPFCVDRFKTITHRCPKCRASIKIIKKL